MLSKSFKSGKCKTSLKLGISRIKLLKNRRDIQVKQLKRELAQLLETGQEQTARIRVEHVIREEKTMSAYDLIEIYCELIVARMPIIESQKSCPIDLKEAICSVIFASPRCADIPELNDVRKQFVAKYGKEFVTSALELRSDSGVNRMIVEKLSAKTPDIETKMKTLTAIAKEHEIKWDSKAFEEELPKPKEDLLNGSSSFTRANKMSMEALNANFSPNTSRTESASNIYHADIPSKPTSSHSSSQANLRTAPPAPTPAPNESRESDGKTRGSEVNYSHPKEVSASFKQPTWKMEFKDAASAAQAAAESAERASIAARAAAELASQENISRQNSNEPNGLSLHSGRDENPKRAVSSKQPPRDELRDEISHHSSSSDEGMDYSSSQMDNVSKLGSRKTHEEVNYDRSESAASFGTLGDDAIWIPPIEQDQTSYHDDLDAGEKLFRYDSKEDDSGDYPAAVFDEYDPEPTDEKENLFDSLEKRQNDQPSLFAPSTSSINSGIFSSARHESRPASVEKLPSSKFDDSDGLTSESDDDTSGSWRNGTSQNPNLQLGRDSHPREELQTSSSAEAKHLQASSSSVGAKDPDELAIGGELGLKFGRLTGGLRNRGYIRPPYTASSVVDSPVSPLETLGSTISSTNQIISPRDKPFTSSLLEDDLSSPIMPGASSNPESNKAKGSLSEESNQGSRRKKTFSADKSEDDDTTGFNQEKSRRYRGSDNASTVSEGINQKIHDEKPRTKAYKELSSRMSKTDFDSDGDVEERDSPVNMENQAIAGSNTAFKLSRRTKDFTSKGPNLPRSADTSNSRAEIRPSRWSSAPEPPSQTADSATIGRGKQNRKSSKPNSSAESMSELSVNEEDKKIAGGTPDPDSTSSVSSGNNKPSDSSGGGTKLQETASQKASHVHPKLPDYETLAAHFQSLRSNRR